MALIENRMTHEGIKKINKVGMAIDRLKAFEPEDGYWLAFSGGKDSVVIKRLTEMAGVKHENHYSCTSVDPPELVRFVKSFDDVSFDKPHDKNGNVITMWNLIPRKLMPPTRIMRYCCTELKESAGKGKLTITGCRWAESANRARNRHLINIGTKNRIVYNDENDESRRMVEQCYRTQKTLVNPIIDWTDSDVWEFIRQEKISYCGLYDDGYKRLGCLGCPENTKNGEELNAYPKYKKLYIKTFEKMLQQRIKKGKKACGWESGQDVYDWWIGKTKNKQIDGQVEMELSEV
jgi:phosphoadenosine phosphosulfate reductase